MSGAIGSLLSASAAVQSLLGGGTGVSIGGVALQGWEIPEQVTWGGAQTLIVHRFPGGAKQVDLTGYFDKSLSFRGLMLAANAVTRARQLDVICRQGSPVPFTFADFQYWVVVRSFEADYARANWTREYRIELEVLPPDQGTGGPTIALDGATDQSSLFSSLNLANPASSAIVNVADATGVVNQFDLGSEFQMAADTGIAATGIGTAVNIGLSGIGAAASVVSSAASMIPAAQSVLSAASVVGAFIPGGSQAVQSLTTALGVAQAATNIGGATYDTLTNVLTGQEPLAATPLGFSVMQASIAARSAVATASAAVGRTLANLTGTP